jgi:hypothetical protein
LRDFGSSQYWRIPIREQLKAELMMNPDIQRYQQRRYVAQVIEILLFNELLLAPRESVEEEDME